MRLVILGEVVVIKGKFVLNCGNVCSVVVSISVVRMGSRVVCISCVWCMIRVLILVGIS